tara:strand:- start:2 stop:385 length:384 start_codon:yes stop_codon:yes gene_type:complete
LIAFFFSFLAGSVYKFEELGFVESFVISSIFGEHFLDFCLFFFRWCILWVFFKVICQNKCEFFIRNLTVMAGVHITEDGVGYFIGDTFTISSSDMDGGSGGDEGEEGEFHFEKFVFLFVIIVLITLA